VRWYVAHPVSDRKIEEMMGERGVEVDQSTFHASSLGPQMIDFVSFPYAKFL
jgi:hypothetical protein